MSRIKEIFNFTVPEVPEDKAHNIITLWALLVVAPISSALIMWGLLPHAMGWIYPVISL